MVNGSSVDSPETAETSDSSPMEVARCVWMVGGRGGRLRSGERGEVDVPCGCPAAPAPAAAAPRAGGGGGGGGGDSMLRLWLVFGSFGSSPELVGSGGLTVSDRASTYPLVECGGDDASDW